ncbi:tautomerase family protein [Apilactobacillus kunkeei]|uniref:4-oxalocrotonate tautomerase n=1 Tax=Apilactobacillus kunkeei TaxID=148814 RepID=A0A1L8CJ10_9LACO|nr:tautomerase family protein [Apilactobacillus kunkeei]GAT91166.1 4-oxalocrotonate tautomerase [Apilactobacillus kunkeei]
MPKMNIDVIKGHDRDYLKQLMDISYHVMLDCFGAPDGDRYQILTQHEDFEMNILDTGLGFDRTNDVVVFSLTTRPRTKEQKLKFYHDLAEQLENKLGIKKTDLMINLTTNTDEDWSFGNGVAQFIDGPLK